MKQRIRKFNGHETRTVRVPSAFYPQCDHLAILLAEGHSLEGVVRDNEGRATRQVHYLQTGVKDGLSVTLEAPPGSTAEGKGLEPVSQAEFTGAIAPCSESYEVMSLAMFCLAVAEKSVNHTCLHRYGFAATSSPLGVSLLETRQTGFELPATLMVEAARSSETVAIAVDTSVQESPPERQADAPVALPMEMIEIPVTSITWKDSALPVTAVDPAAIAVGPTAHATPEMLSRSQAFGKRLFRVWRSLALEQAKGSETPWSCYVEIEDVYRRAFSTLQGTTFLSDLANLEGREISFGGVLHLNTLDAGEEGIEMNGRCVSKLTFTLIRGASISVASQTIPLTVTANPEAPDTSHTVQFANTVTQVDSQCNGLTSRLQRFCNKLLPRTFLPS